MWDFKFIPSMITPFKNKEGRNWNWYPNMNKSWRALCPFSQSQGKCLPLLDKTNFTNFLMNARIVFIFPVVVLVGFFFFLFVTIRNLSFLYLELDQAWQFWDSPRDLTGLNQDNLIIFSTSTMLAHKGLVVAFSQSIISDIWHNIYLH